MEGLDIDTLLGCDCPLLNDALKEFVRELDQEKTVNAILNNSKATPPFNLQKRCLE